MEAIDVYLDRLASNAPAPGGGSAAAIVGASGAALVAMVARICLASKKYAAYHQTAAVIAARADHLRTRLLQARRIDEAAFNDVVRAQALPRGDARQEALERALENAARAPLDTAEAAVRVARLADGLLAIPNRNLLSDIGCAAEFACSATMACGYNIRINHQFMKNTEIIARQSEEIERYEREALAILHGVRIAMKELRVTSA